MTIEKSKGILIPGWMITIIISVISAGFIAWGTISTVNVKMSRAERDIETLRIEKVNKDEFDRIYTRLDKIEKKIDDLKGE